MLVHDELQLTGRRIGEIEDKIGAGLIEEVIDVAQGELNLVDTMEKSKMYVPSRETSLKTDTNQPQMGGSRGEAC